MKWLAYSFNTYFLLFFIALLLLPVTFADPPDYNDPESYQDADFYTNSDPNQWDYSKVDWEKVDLSRAEVYSSQDFYDNLPADKFSEIDYNQVDYTKISDHSKVDSAKYFQDKSCGDCTLDRSQAGVTFSDTGLSHESGDAVTFKPFFPPHGSKLISTADGIEIVLRGIDATDDPGMDYRTVGNVRHTKGDSYKISSESNVLFQGDGSSINYVAIGNEEVLRDNLVFKGEMVVTADGDLYVPEGGSAYIHAMDGTINAKDTDVFFYMKDTLHPSGDFVQVRPLLDGNGDNIHKDKSLRYQQDYGRQLVLNGAGYEVKFDSKVDLVDDGDWLFNRNFNGDQSYHDTQEIVLRPMGGKTVLTPYEKRTTQIDVHGYLDIRNGNEFSHITRTGISVLKGNSASESSIARSSDKLQPYHFSVSNYDREQIKQHTYLFSDTGEIISSKFYDRDPSKTDPKYLSEYEMILDSNGFKRKPMSYKINGFSNFHYSRFVDDEIYFDQELYYYDDDFLEKYSQYDQRKDWNYEEYREVVDLVGTYEDQSDIYKSELLAKASRGDVLPLVGYMETETDDKGVEVEEFNFYNYDYYSDFSYLLDNSETDSQRDAILLQLGKTSYEAPPASESLLLIEGTEWVDFQPDYFFGSVANEGNLELLAIQHASTQDVLEKSLKNLGYSNEEIALSLEKKSIYDKKYLYSEKIDSLGMSDTEVLSAIDAAVVQTTTYRTEYGSHGAFEEILNTQIAQGDRAVVNSDMAINIYHHGYEVGRSVQWGPSVEEAAKEFREAGMDVGVYSPDDTSIAFKDKFLSDIKDPSNDNMIFATQNHGNPTGQYFGKELIRMDGNTRVVSEKGVFISNTELSDALLTRFDKSTNSFGNIHVHVGSCSSTDFANTVVRSLEDSLVKQGVDVTQVTFPSITTTAKSGGYGYSGGLEYLHEMGKNLKKDGDLTINEHRRLNKQFIEESWNKPALFIPRDTGTGVIQITENDPNTDGDFATT